MKNHHHRIVSLFLPLVASIGLSSCVDPNYAGGSYHSYPRGAYGAYNTLPGNYIGSAYYYNGRYYSGGTYQTGHYNYRGRPYSNRYYHNGQYFYGGNYQNHPQTGPRRDHRNHEPERSRNPSDLQRVFYQPSDRYPENRPVTSGLQPYGPGGR